MTDMEKILEKLSELSTKIDKVGARLETVDAVNNAQHDRLEEVLRRVEAQTIKTNGSVAQNIKDIKRLEITQATIISESKSSARWISVIVALGGIVVSLIVSLI